jgi:hypothetical protein
VTKYTPLWLQAGAYPAGVDRHLLSSLWPTARCDGMQVTAGSATTVNIGAGNAVVPSPNNSGSALCVSDAPDTHDCGPAPGSGQGDRIDVLICQPRGSDWDGSANTDFWFTHVTGVAAGTPTVPAVPAGSLALAHIYRTNGSASIGAGDITDVRPGTMVVQPPYVPEPPYVPPASNPLGFVALSTGPPANIDVTAYNFDIFHVDWTQKANRRYKVSASIAWSQVSAASTSGTWDLRNDTFGYRETFYNEGVALNLAKRLQVAGAHQWPVVTADRAVSVSLAGQDNAGAARFTANSCWLLVEDMGGT